MSDATFAPLPLAADDEPLFRHAAGLLDGDETLREARAAVAAAYARERLAPVSGSGDAAAAAAAFAAALETSLASAFEIAGLMQSGSETTAVLSEANDPALPLRGTPAPPVIVASSAAPAGTSIDDLTRWTFTYELQGALAESDVVVAGTDTTAEWPSSPLAAVLQEFVARPSATTANAIATALATAEAPVAPARIANAETLRELPATRRIDFDLRTQLSAHASAQTVRNTAFGAAFTTVSPVIATAPVAPHLTYETPFAITEGTLAQRLERLIAAVAFGEPRIEVRYASPVMPMEIPVALVVAAAVDDPAQLASELETAIVRWQELAQPPAAGGYLRIDTTVMLEEAPRLTAAFHLPM